MELFLSVSYISFFVFIIYKWSFFEVIGLSHRTISFFFILKIFAGVCVWAIYTYYYTYRPTADAFKYFDASKVMFDSLFDYPLHFIRMLTGIGGNHPDLFSYYDKMNFWLSHSNSSIYNDNHLIIRINTLIRFFSFGFYQVHTIFFSFFSLVGLTALFKLFYSILPQQRNWIMMIVFCVPSLLFWGSGVLKESLILAAMGVFIYQFTRRLSLSSILIGGVSAMLLATLKFYVFISFFPSIIFLFLLKKSGNSYMLWKCISVILVVSLMGLNIDKIGIGVQNPLVTLSQKQADFNRLANGESIDALYKSVPKAGSTIVINKLEPTLRSFIINSPQGLINTLLRPYPWEIVSATMLLAFIENLLIVLFLFFCLRYIKPIETVEWKVVLACMSFVIIQFIIIGTTTPIIGAIVRYKVPAIPFLLFAFLIMKRESIKKKSPL